jgi:RND superfamily putative drug exporter
MRTTGTAVLWSGATVLVAESTLLLIDSRSVRSAAFGMVMVTFFAVLTTLSVAPTLFSLLGPRLIRSRLPGSNRDASHSGWWERWARRVTGKGPWWLAVSSVVVVALAVPAIRLSRSVNISAATALPADASVRQAYELAAARYGPGAMSPIVVLVKTRATAAQQEGVIRKIAAVVNADGRVARTQIVPLAAGSAVLAVTSKSDPYGTASRDLVASLRSATLHNELANVHLIVGGETATSLDATKAMFGGLPRVGILLLLIVMAILLLALRSVLLPLKAVILVILSLGASLGGLLLLTGSRLGSWLIGAGSPSDIHPIVPVTIVAITVALSTDYEVMLISRIAEHYKRTGDNEASIVEGVARTGGVITSAAAVMIAVFLGFALAHLAPLKQLGVGLALAVLLDATVVRGIMVPSSMSVLGRSNWWIPSRRRYVPKHRMRPQRSFRTLVMATPRH